MRIDVSEIKTYRGCRRQWQLTSRNQFHLRPLVTPPAFALGTIFHEALAMMYLDVKLDKVMEMVRREMQTDNDAALLAMVPGYYHNVLPGDLERYKVLDIEHKFEYIPTTRDGELLFTPEPLRDDTGAVIPGEFVHPVTICGSIDLVVLDIEENAIYGFEHKTAKAFREETYLWMDEQPRVYTWALEQFVREYNTKHQHSDGFVPVTLGGIYINEVKKLLRQFQYKRTLCKYSEEDMDNFMAAFFATCNSVKNSVERGGSAPPSPGWMTCQMCSFQTICSTYMYEHLDKDAIIEEFAEEFHERSEDHLDEKVERSKE